ncbi:peptide deformylase [Sneathiella sp. P13V-1]|uniref:peptide deformylase n=1 Tax=Sneathiella sp. P13V-1 TaxID=2697366 RepID=UPI00187B61D3|nr:peptide deformylase [Sneathiella sp. P13V-1]MBE7635428.1 peptide deformylase [Sneathiella sp. P13V-1]
MALLPIITAPDPFLKTISEPVAEVNDEIRKLVDDMFETMYAAPGIGLAAIQVGVQKRVLVVDIVGKNDEGNKPQPIAIINPEITWVSDDDSVYEEGCLSVPAHYADVVRPAEIKVSYLDVDGNKQELHADSLLATCIQHEIDHLDGILFVDHLSALKRNMILRKLLKQKKQAS